MSVITGQPFPRFDEGVGFDQALNSGLMSTNIPYQVGRSPLGPWRVGGNLYAFFPTWSLVTAVMCKSTDNGLTWAGVDRNPMNFYYPFQTTSQMAVMADGTDIVVAYSEYPTGLLTYAAFDTLTDTWGTPITTGTYGSTVVWWIGKRLGIPYVLHADTFMQLAYQEFSGGAWQPPVDIATLGGYGYAFDFRLGAAAYDPVTEKITIFPRYTDGGTGNDVMDSLTLHTDNSISTPFNVFNEPFSGDNYKIAGNGNGISFNGAVRVIFWKTGKYQMFKGNSASEPTAYTTQDVLVTNANLTTAGVPQFGLRLDAAATGLVMVAKDYDYDATIGANTEQMLVKTTSSDGDTWTAETVLWRLFPAPSNMSAITFEDYGDSTGLGGLNIISSSVSTGIPYFVYEHTAGGPSRYSYAV